MLKGIDASHHNGAVDWKKVKAAGVEFAMLRAGFGWDNDSQIDRQLQNNIQGCEAAGLPYGLYHYSYAQNPADAKREAAFFLRVIRDAKPLYPVAFDFEEKAQLALPPETQLAIIEAFLGEIKAAGYYGILYMSASSLENLNRYARERIGRFDCWVAHIDTDKPAFSGDYGIWQYSWKGKIDGIQGNVDLDYAYRDYPALIKEAGLNGWEAKKPVPETVPKAQYDALAARVAELAEEMEALIKKLKLTI